MESELLWETHQCSSQDKHEWELSGFPLPKVNKAQHSVLFKNKYADPVLALKITPILSKHTKILNSSSMLTSAS